MISAIKFLGLAGGKPPLPPTGSPTSRRRPLVAVAGSSGSFGCDSDSVASHNSCGTSNSSTTTKQEQRRRRRTTSRSRSRPRRLVGRRCAVVVDVAGNNNNKNQSQEQEKDHDDDSSCCCDLSSVNSFQSNRSNTARSTTTANSIANDRNAAVDDHNKKSKSHNKDKNRKSVIDSSAPCSPHNKLLRSQMNNQRATALLSHMNQQVQIQQMFHGNNLLSV